MQLQCRQAQPVPQIVHARRRGESATWWQRLPPAWKELVVAPVEFEVFHEYEVAADRTIGRDESDEPCYCASRCLITELRSDDDECFYEAVAYAENLAAWRLRDGRWLIWREVAGPCHGAGHRFFTLGEAMPS